MMLNLYFLLLDGCSVSRNFENISNELCWLQWRNMSYLGKLNLSKLVSLNLSYNTKLVNLWTISNPWLEVCFVNSLFGFKFVGNQSNTSQVI